MYEVEDELVDVQEYHDTAKAQLKTASERMLAPTCYRDNRRKCSCIPNSCKRSFVGIDNDAHEDYETYCWHLNEPADIEPPVVLKVRHKVDHGRPVGLRVW
jgi:hypothetical protein